MHHLKSCRRVTLNLSTNADSSTDTITFFLAFQVGVIPGILTCDVAFRLIHTYSTFETYFFKGDSPLFLLSETHPH